MVTIAVPVLNGMRWLPGVIDAACGQEISDDLEILASDSGSSDGSRQFLVRRGVRVLDVAPGTFHHAATRNLLMQHARGEFVAMITQDAEPAGRQWLAHLLHGFTLADDVALAYGPYLPRPDCSPREASRLNRFFSGLSPDGTPRIDRLEPGDRELPVSRLIGPLGYFTDANGCIRRDAWRQVPYPDVPYAEDHALAVTMLRAGFAKVYDPRAGVLHSHHYTPLQQLRRTFDDWRGLREIYGWREPITAQHILQQLRGAGGAAHRSARASGLSWGADAAGVAAAVAEHGLRLSGAILGSRADRLPRRTRRRLSLEGRDTFAPFHAGRPGAPSPVTDASRPGPDELPQTPSAPVDDGNAWR